MKKILGPEKLFKGRHFERDMIVLCVRFKSMLNATLRPFISRRFRPASIGKVQTHKSPLVRRAICLICLAKIWLRGHAGA